MNTLGHLLTKNSPDSEPKSVVYKINCCDCDICYIGKTDRFISCRMKQHKRDLINGKNETGLGEHASTGHSFDFDNVRVMARCTNERRLIYQENYYIAAADKKNQRTANRIKNVIMHPALTDVFADTL